MPLYFAAGDDGAEGPRRVFYRESAVGTLSQDVFAGAQLSRVAGKDGGVREMIEARGARLVYLPPYSPEFNPIEQFFAKLKAMLRKAKERTIDTLWLRIGQLLDVKPSECANYLRNAGYA